MKTSNIITVLLGLSVVVAVGISAIAAGLLPEIPGPKKIKSDTEILILTNSYTTPSGRPDGTENLTTTVTERWINVGTDPKPFLGTGPRTRTNTQDYLISSITEPRTPQPRLTMEEWQRLQPSIPTPIPPMPPR